MGPPPRGHGAHDDEDTDPQRRATPRSPGPARGRLGVLAEVDDDVETELQPEEAAVPDDVDSAQYQTRGLNPLGALRYVRHHHGDDGVVSVLAGLSAGDRAVLGGDTQEGLRSATWVPFLTHARLLRAIDARFGAGDLALLPGVGRFMAQADLPGLLKPVLRLMTPAFLITQTMRLWRGYHSHGRWELVRTSGDLRAVLVDHPVAHPAFCATFCGFVEGALAFSGARAPHVEQTACRCHGDRACAFYGVFEERGVDAARGRVPRPPN